MRNGRRQKNASRVTVSTIVTKSSARAPLWATLVATSMGAGFVPVAPGHSGTLTAVAMAWGLLHLGRWALVAGFVVITAIGTYASSVFLKAWGRDDDQRIVIDEVAGYLLTVMFVPGTWVNLIAGFFLFRLFDVWKPQPVRYVDQTVGGGWGVMLDDLVAGVYGALFLFALDRSGWLQRLWALGAGP